jgi:Helix-turn-helix domain
LSVRLMAEIFGLDVPPSEKLVLLALADHARDDGTGAYPSIDRLARKSSLSRRGVQKIMRRLEGAGFVVPTGNLQGGRGLATEYRITVEKGAPGSLFSTAKGRTSEHKRANLSAEKGEPGSPQSLRTVIEAAEAAAAARSTPSPVWKALGLDHPIGTLKFQSTLEFYYAHRNGDPLAEVMERAIQRAGTQGIPVPPPFYQAKRRVEEAERATAATVEDEIPLAEPYR